MKLLSAFYSILIVYGIILSLIGLASLPENPLTPGFATKKIFKSVMPQGWGFFTRNPRENQLFLFRVVDNSLELVNNSENSLSHNLYGLRRIHSAIGIEFGVLLNRVKDSDWIECDSSIYSCVQNEVIPSVIIKNMNPEPILCGDFVVVEQEVVPWVWYNSSNINMPLKFTKISVRCP